MAQGDEQVDEPGRDDGPGMPQESGASAGAAEDAAVRHGWRGRRAVGWAAAIMLALLVIAWFARENIADEIITAQLESFELPGTYEIVAISPDRQVLRNIVIGDPARPDLTVERAEIVIRPAFGLPRIAELVLFKPRLYGHHRDGRVSFGALDPLIYDRETQQPAALPDLNLAIHDGRAVITSAFGPVGVKAQGRGNLASGFSGILAVAAPDLRMGDCRATGGSLYGVLTTAAGQPGFDGPLRVGALACEDAGLTAQKLAMQIKAKGDTDLAGLDIQAGLSSGPWVASAARLGAGTGSIKASWRADRLTGAYEIRANTVAAGPMRLARLVVEGGIRGRDGLAVLDAEGSVRGEGAAMAPETDAALASWGTATQDSLLAPVLQKIRRALAREARDGALDAHYTFRKAGGRASLVVPNAALRGRSGAALASVTRLQFGVDEAGVRHLSGNFATGGADLPRLSGQMDQRGDRVTHVRLAMPEYRAEDARLAMPDLRLVLRPSGLVGFAGDVIASGALPGGEAQGLVVPVSGDWSQRGGLSLWRSCTRLRFDRLALANLQLEKRALDLCPSRKAAIVQSSSRGLRIAAGIPRIDVAGRLGETPIRIRSKAVGLAYPGVMTARGLDVLLGPPDSASHFLFARLEAHLGGTLAGRFSDADVRLSTVPLNLLEAEGNWRYADGRLSLSEGVFRLEDRKADASFRPLVAREARLTLENNRITAQGLLREPASDRVVVGVDLRHDLATGGGRADLRVDALRFDRKLQPDMLSRHALGVIANTFAEVNGRGEVVWNDAGVRSTGAFSTENADFAAAFGPAKGVSGTVRFSDLIGLTTEPDQKLYVASINPGIEANDGVITYELRDGEVLSLKDAAWPFLGGRLTMRPTAMRVGVAETRHYVLDLEGVDAAQFVARMEMGNINATGTFDGSLPLVFDEDGGRIEGGALVSRLPGGNVSYVGELTYQDLTPIANFAFNALRSLDYREMRIDFEGSLTGEIITRVRFDGIAQGAGAKRNILTRQVAKLPIRFNVNIRAPFYKLVTSIRAMYDPAFIRDPREVGLVDRAGRAIADPQSQFLVPAPPELPEP